MKGKGKSPSPASFMSGAVKGKGKDQPKGKGKGPGKGKKGERRSVSSPPQSYREVLRQFGHLCHQWAANGHCPRGPSCTRPHIQVSVTERARLREALNAQAEYTSASQPRVRPGICREMRENGTCPRGDDCWFIHNESQAEIVRAT